MSRPQHSILTSCHHVLAHNIDVHVVDGGLAGNVGGPLEPETGGLGEWESDTGSMK